ncbi:hypothetical protein GCM10007063_12400 [Lentibacillus kapialis]|uniref:Uncharacterized protein n=1 Tax=Lentibacillus kapialis TaxID=340214 RepID=A0A917PTK1_9BACI|nr:hypothetical protein GCM10007063_12400 [Lentibacillus kapialis]
MVFQAKWIDGSLDIQPEEIKDATFARLTESTIDYFITRPHFKSRTLDAMKASAFIPYETWNTATYHLLGRLEARKLTENQTKNGPVLFFLSILREYSIIYTLVHVHPHKKLDYPDLTDPRSAKSIKIALFSIEMNPHSANRIKTGGNQSKKDK